MVRITLDDEIYRKATEIARKKFSFLIRNRKLVRDLEEVKRFRRLGTRSYIINLILMEWISQNTTTQEQIYSA